jgi:hypothetical protein
MNVHQIDTVSQFYGSGVVYIANADRVYSFPEQNDDIESMRVGTRRDFWIIDEIAVCLATDVPRRRAIKLLRPC